MPGSGIRLYAACNIRLRLIAQDIATRWAYPANFLLYMYYDCVSAMSYPVQDPPPTEMPPSVSAPGPSAATDIFDDAIEYRNGKKIEKKIL